jgi:hypothetical protein
VASGSPDCQLIFIHISLSLGYLKLINRFSSPSVPIFSSVPIFFYLLYFFWNRAPSVKLIISYMLVIAIDVCMLLRKIEKRGPLLSIFGGTYMPSWSIWLYQGVRPQNHRTAKCDSYFPGSCRLGVEDLCQFYTSSSLGLQTWLLWLPPTIPSTTQFFVPGRRAHWLCWCGFDESLSNAGWWEVCQICKVWIVTVEEWRNCDSLATCSSVKWLCKVIGRATRDVIRSRPPAKIARLLTWAGPTTFS